MKTVNEKYQDIITRVSRLAQERDDIRAAIMVGSRARQDTPADDWSDLDVSIVTTTPNFYINEESWLREIGDYWVTFIENTATGEEKERRVIFEDGLDVDFAILPVETVCQIMANSGKCIPEDIKYSLGRGFRILIDKDSLFDNLSEADLKTAVPVPPSKQEFLNHVNDFIYHYVWTLKKLRRQELWTAKGCSDNYLKWRLLTLSEWHARIINGNAYDTWHCGRFFEKWADPRVVDGMKHSFAHFDAVDILRALNETYKIFRMLAIEVAEKLNYSFPFENEEKVIKWTDNIVR